MKIKLRQSAVIDRIVDGRIAVLLFDEGEEQLQVSVDKLPEGSKEGTWLVVLVQDGELIWAELDPEKTREVQERIKSKRALLLERRARRRD